MESPEKLTIEKAIDIFENSYSQEDKDEDIKQIPFKVSEIKNICDFLHYVRTSGIYTKYNQDRQ